MKKREEKYIEEENVTHVLNNHHQIDSCLSQRPLVIYPNHNLVLTFPQKHCALSNEKHVCSCIKKDLKKAEALISISTRFTAPVSRQCTVVNTHLKTTTNVT